MQLLERANSTIQLQALIEPLGQPVLVAAGPLSQSDIDKYEWCLRTNHFGNWIERDQSGHSLKLVDADAGMKIPRITVSPGLASPKDDTPRKYVLVMEGVSGTRKAKVIVEDRLENTATTMMHAALNGYSTVFSAAFFHRSSTTIFAPSIGPLNARFVKADTVQEASSAPTEKRFNLLC